MHKLNENKVIRILLIKTVGGIKVSEYCERVALVNECIECGIE